MSDFNTLATRGDPISADVIASAFLYPNTSSVRSETKTTVRNGLEHALDQLYNSAEIQYYEIAIHKENMGGLNDSTEDEFDKYFRYWVEGNCDDSFVDGDCGGSTNPNTSTDYTQYHGVHVGVADGFDFANAEGFDTKSAFAQGIRATVGTAGSSDKYKNFGAQEPLHCWIDNDLSTVDDMTNDGSHLHEHDLGIVHDDTTGGNRGSVSPMATLYTGNTSGKEDHADHDGESGGCATFEPWDGTYDTTITSCTKDAVGATANDDEF